MDFIDEAVEKQRLRLSKGKARPKTETEEAVKKDQQIREQVDQILSEVVLPVLIAAKIRLEQQGVKADLDVENAISFDTERIYNKGAKLQLAKGLDRKSGVPVVIGPSLYFSASPPYSTTFAVVAYGAENSAIFSERLEIEEVTKSLVLNYLKRFIEDVVR